MIMRVTNKDIGSGGGPLAQYAVTNSPAAPKGVNYASRISQDQQKALSAALSTAYKDMQKSMEGDYQFTTDGGLQIQNVSQVNQADLMRKAVASVGLDPSVVKDGANFDMLNTLNSGSATGGKKDIDPYRALSFAHLPNEAGIRDGIQQGLANPTWGPERIQKAAGDYMQSHQGGGVLQGIIGADGVNLLRGIGQAAAGFYGGPLGAAAFSTANSLADGKNIGDSIAGAAKSAALTYAGQQIAGLTNGLGANFTDNAAIAKAIDAGAAGTARNVLGGQNIGQALANGATGAAGNLAGGYTDKLANEVLGDSGLDPRLISALGRSSGAGAFAGVTNRDVGQYMQNSLTDSAKNYAKNGLVDDLSKIGPIDLGNGIKAPEWLANINLPKFDLPDINLPKFDLAGLNLPKFNLPDLPKFDLPSLPKFDLPSLPNIDLPKFSGIDLPKIDLPNLPSINLPNVSLPKIPSIASTGSSSMPTSSTPSTEVASNALGKEKNGYSKDDKEGIMKMLVQLGLTPAMAYKLAPELPSYFDKSQNAPTDNSGDTNSDPNADPTVNAATGGRIVGVGGLAHGGEAAKFHPSSPKGHHPEFITGLSGSHVKGRGDGQSDDVPAMLKKGDWVADADVVAALGNGSSEAGAGVLAKLQNSIKYENVHTGDVPAMVAKDEVVLPAGFVTALGKGSNEQGAKMLDAMREELRKHKRSAPADKIPPPAKSPLAYMQEGMKG